MAMAGPCSVPGEAWASPCWLGSSAHWPRHSTLRGHPYKNPDRKMGPCDLGGSAERLWKAQPGRSCGLTPEEVACQCVESSAIAVEAAARGMLLQPPVVDTDIASNSRFELLLICSLMV